jgi:putative CocE/NonD family hydrolase
VEHTPDPLQVPGGVCMSSGTTNARGTISGGQVIPSTYVSSITTDQKKHDEVRMVISSGSVKEFVADPPTVQSPDRVPLTEDQRFVQGRPDVLTWQTDTLADNLTIAGEVFADLFASTTGSDADWIVKLIDVYPENVPNDAKMGGYEFMVSNEVFRGRYRTSYEKPTPIEPNTVLEYTWSLHTQNYTFKKGHRVMVQVQSTWFPIIDRNPQTFVPNIFFAKPGDFVKASQRVYHAPGEASYVDLPVVP